MTLTNDEARKLCGCEGKARFDSAPLAQKVAKRRTERGKVGHAYRCEFCGGWHIGLRHAAARRGAR
jgi:hypothetical protein